MSERYDIDGPAGRLQVDDGGSGGLPVVFVHALAGNVDQWDPQLDHLRPGRRAVAFDLRGHGASEVPRNLDYTFPGMARDVADVADFLELERFVLVGHSMGGGVVASYAGAHPERVAGLFFVDPMGDQRAERRELEDFLEVLRSDAYHDAVESFWEEKLEGSTPEVYERVMDDLRSTPPETVVGVVGSMLDFDPTGAMEACGGPMVAVVTPRNDDAYSLHNLIPELRVEVMTGTSHWVHLDRPELFHRHLDAFLDELGGP